MIKLKVSSVGGGGPAIFMNRLLDYMQEHEMVKLSTKHPEIYLSTIWPGDPPKRCKWVHRAASVYYYYEKRKCGPGLNMKIKRAIDDCDHAIYQSKFAEKLHRKILRSKKENKSYICNGFDANQFNHVAPRIFDSSNVFVACSKWIRPIKRGDDIIGCFLKSKMNDALLVMIGSYPNSGYFKKKNKRVLLLDDQNIESIAAILKAKPYFVHMCYAESCPNAVVEALSFGCPVLCNNIGGTREVVGKDGLIVECDKEFVYKRRKIKFVVPKPDVVAQGFRDIVQTTWAVDRTDLSMESCASQYLKVFEGVLS